MPNSGTTAGYDDFAIHDKDSHVTYRLPRYSILRLYLTASILLKSVTILLDVNTPTHKYIASTGHFGWAYLIGLIVVCLISFADCFVNDIMPERYTIKRALAWRPKVFAVMAVMTFGLSFVQVMSYGIRWTARPFLLDSLIVMVVAFLDAFHRLQRGAK